MKTLMFVIADDASLYREILRQMVQSQPAWVIVGEAADGQAALELVRQHTPDVVLLDVNMPVMNGIETTRQIKHTWPATTVFVFSGYDDEEFRHESLSAGAGAYLRKEDVDAEILARLVAARFSLDS